MKTLKQIKEQVPANAVGGGMSPVVGGEGDIKGFDPIMGGGLSLLRRKLPLKVDLDKYRKTFKQFIKSTPDGKK